MFWQKKLKDSLQFMQMKRDREYIYFLTNSLQTQPFPPKWNWNEFIRIFQMCFPVIPVRWGWVGDKQIQQAPGNCMLLLTASNQDVSTLLIKSAFSPLMYTLFFILNCAKMFSIGNTAIMPGICFLFYFVKTKPCRQELNAE